MSDVGNQLLALVKQLVELAIEKEQAITTRELERLETLNKQELTILKELSTLEKQQILPQPDEVIVEMQRFQKQLREQLKTNQQLLEDALQFTRYLLGQITEQNESQSYQPGNQATPGRSVAFDFKA
ncbi:hypothetical protein JOD03_000890 [Chryseomicrobium aureum]|uniref:hypothetical protein n=1 Tax=Chryseomicrobium aureum TaxID=1441723 RepID=UPI00195879BA|nr:hypothetical protein [Chryseomicrobium aureum]MBM7705988.1 hypothetical protein [Chryseomicrobium aureum]